MKFLVVVCLLGAFAATANASKQYSFGHMNVFNYLKVLTNPEIYALIAQKEVQWPTYDTIPPASFSCAQKDFPGFYADPTTRCQTFHRCDPNGNMTSYICVNRTVFNPITLICDHWFNVDCDGYMGYSDSFCFGLVYLDYCFPSYICVNRTVFNPITLICDHWFNVDCDGFVKDEYFGNRRLYTKDPLFDTVTDNAGDKPGISGKWIWVQDDAPAAAPVAKAAEA